MNNQNKSTSNSMSSLIRNKIVMNNNYINNTDDNTNYYHHHSANDTTTTIPGESQLMIVGSNDVPTNFNKVNEIEGSNEHFIHGHSLDGTIVVSDSSSLSAANSVRLEGRIPNNTANTSFDDLLLQEEPSYPVKGRKDSLPPTAVVVVANDSHLLYRLAAPVGREQNDLSKSILSSVPMSLQILLDPNAEDKEMMQMDRSDSPLPPIPMTSAIPTDTEHSISSSDENGAVMSANDFLVASFHSSRHHSLFSLHCPTPSLLELNNNHTHNYNNNNENISNMYYANHNNNNHFEGEIAPSRMGNFTFDERISNDKLTQSIGYSDYRISSGTYDNSRLSVIDFSERELFNNYNIINNNNNNNNNKFVITAEANSLNLHLNRERASIFSGQLEEEMLSIVNRYTEKQ